MVDNASARHFNTESLASLTKAHALSYVYYKQKGDMKTANQFMTGKDVKKIVEKIEKGKVRRKIKANRSTGGIGSADWVRKETGGF